MSVCVVELTISDESVIVEENSVEDLVSKLVLADCTIGEDELVAMDTGVSDVADVG